jgi:hypothetical protein
MHCSPTLKASIPYFREEKQDSADKGGRGKARAPFEVRSGGSSRHSGEEPVSIKDSCQIEVKNLGAVVKRLWQGEYFCRACNKRNAESGMFISSLASRSAVHHFAGPDLLTAHRKVAHQSLILYRSRQLSNKL